MTSPPVVGIDPLAAQGWVDSWDRQQERYAIAREERFSVVAEVVAAITGDQARPVVVDLGCGPGALAARVARRIPRADLIGLDADPLLLALGRATSPHVDFRDVVVGADGWTDGLPETVDAVVSSTALHYFRPSELASLYADLAGRLRPGGVLVNADHLPAEDVVLDILGREVARLGTPSTLDPRPDWATWWAMVAREPSLRALLEEQRARPVPSGDHPVPASVHSRLLLENGFSRSGVVWQYGPSAVLVAVR